MFICKVNGPYYQSNQTNDISVLYGKYYRIKLKELVYQNKKVERILCQLSSGVKSLTFLIKVQKIMPTIL